VGQRSDEIKRHIDNQREQLGENLERLEERVRSSTDWRTQYSRHPFAALGIAFGGGLLLGVVTVGRGRDNRRKYSGDSGSYSSAGYGTSSLAGAAATTGGAEVSLQRSRRRSSATSRQLHRAWETIDTVRGALIGLGAVKLKEFLSDALPGFNRQYEETEKSRKESSESRSGQRSGSSGEPSEL
jgi:hypothetical protein